MLAVVACWPLVIPPSARAEDFFQLSAQSTSGPPVSVSAGASNIVDLVDDLVNRKSEFIPLAGDPFAASLTYGGVKNAAAFSANADATSVTLSFPATGFSRTFTGSSSNDVKNQIRDFFKKDGADAYARFLRSINENSPVSAVDGNPQSATAFLAAESFKHFGLQSTLPLHPRTDDNNNNISFDFSAGHINTDSIDGNYSAFDFQFTNRFNNALALSFAIPVQYRNYNGSRVYTVGGEIALPVTLINTQADGGLGWQITPFALGAIAASVDQAAGGVLTGGGITNHLSFTIGPLTLAMANQFSYYHGTPVTAGDYEFQTDVDQPIVKNGGQIVWNLSKNFYLQASVAYTSFLHDAAVPNYWTPAGGVGWRFGPGAASGIRVGYSGDFGPGYSANGANVLLYFNY